MGSIVLSMLQQFLTTNESLSVDFAEALVLYEQELIEPPYFADNGYFGTPVLNFYDNFMEAGMLPLQYIKIRPDHHIRQIYANVIFPSSSDLHALYDETAEFFTSIENDNDIITLEASGSFTHGTLGLALA